MRSGKATVLVIVAGVVIGLTAGSGSATSPPPSEPATQATLPATETVSEATLPATETVASDSVWEKVVPGGDCVCADGSEFNFWVREADPAKVVLFLEGGGACFDPTTCAFTEEDDDLRLEHLAGRRAVTDGWHLTFDRAENPFADYSFVYVPYCTGDVHLGNVTREYSPDLTVEHVGMVNGDAALGYLAENFADAEQVVVVGESHGSIASPVYAGLVSDLLPDAQITVYADGSGAYPDDPPRTPGSAACGAPSRTCRTGRSTKGSRQRTGAFRAIWVQAGLHDPEIVMSRFDFAYDEVQAAFMGLTGSDTSDIAASIAANEAMIEEAGVVQHSFTAPGTDHTLVRNDGFYDMEVGGTTLSDWVADVIAGEDVVDVCEECGAPGPDRRPASSGCQPCGIRNDWRPESVRVGRQCAGDSCTDRVNAATSRVVVEASSSARHTRRKSSNRVTGRSGRTAMSVRRRAVSACQALSHPMPVPRATWSSTRSTCTAAWVIQRGRAPTAAQ